MKKITVFLTAVLMLFTTTLLAQNQVSGIVTDAGTGEPIAGAFVQVKGTLTGVQAGPDGSYTVRVANPKDAVLVFTDMGHKTMEVPVNGRSFINVEMETDATMLEETVVVAYGTQKKEAVTGSVSSVKGEVISAQPVTSVDKALSGKLAGVAISATSGQPGSVSQIRIRGTGSINASAAPLWVVDGIPVITGDISYEANQNSALTALNPNDIESITVLKDAAAAAAYGSQAANGVILVTTKSGKEGRAQFIARAKYGMNWLQPDGDFRMMTASELLGYQRQAIINAGFNPDDPSGSFYRPLSLLNQKLYNPLREFSRIGTTQEYEIGANGGNSKAKYYTSFSYHDTKGVFYGVFFKRLQGRINASYKLLPNLESGVRFNLAYTEQSDVPMQSLYTANPIWTGETTPPWYPLTDENGDFVGNSAVNSGENPRATANYDEKWDHSFHINGTVNLKWEPIKNLTLETRNSLESFFVYSRTWYNPKAHDNAYAHQLETADRQIHQLTTSNTATYSNVFGNVYSLSVVIGQEAKRAMNWTTSAYSPSVDPSMPYHTTADQTTTEIGYGESRETMLSFFGIADYNYDNRYFLQALLRGDGSSLFGADRKWGLFWALSGSWNISREKFMANVKPISLLKLRLSYGVTGNNDVGAYAAYGLYGASIYNGITGYLPSQLENRVLSWERNKTINAGLDFGLFDNRLTGSIDWYNRKTVDLLLTKKIPQTTGFSSIFSNVGSMRNRGLELQLEYAIIHNTDWLWSVGGNVSFNRTKILDLGGDPFIEVNSGVRIAAGRSMYSYYLLDYYGVNPTNGEALYVASIDEKTGAKTLTNDYNKAMRYYCGSPEPKAVGGFNTALQWKGLALSAFFEFKAGNNVLLWNEHHYLEDDGMSMSRNQFACALNYWKQPGDVGVNPKPVAGNSTNSNDWDLDRWVERGDYLRIKDVTLSYTLPQNLTKKIHINNARIYLSGLNLYCFNDVYFWDPEQGVTGYTGGQYPITKAFVGGIELTF